jgi:protein-S-isoprenylcysteine O-methyltransferase Ste14
MPAVRFIAIGASMAAYFGLAVLGAGGPAAFFSQPALIGLTFVFAALGVTAFLAGGNMSSGEREDRSNRWVIPVFMAVGLALAYLPAYTDRIDFWTIDGEITRWVGVFLFAIGGALRLWPVFILGNRFSGLVAIQPGHRLVTTGIYSAIRHPSYLGLFMSALGWALAFRSGAGVLLTLLLIVPIVGRMRSEENLLRTQFGAEYETYRARTSRLIPGVY